MSASLERRPAGGRSHEDGHVLVLVVLVLSMVGSLVLSGITVVTDRTVDLRGSGNQLVAQHAAHSGVERQLADIKLARDMGLISSPFFGLDSLDSNPATGPGGYTQTYEGEPLLDMAGNLVAEYDVLVDVLDSGQQRTIAITCYAYAPSKAVYLSGSRDAMRADAHAVSRVELKAGEVFDYSYFINHWGWFFANTITSNGNVRANGQFDFGDYSPTVNGSPRYQSADGHRLVGYIDDNEDGITDGSDGGVYAGMGVLNAKNVKGMGALAENQHTLLPAIPMPNLSELGFYEDKARELGGTIKIGETTYVDQVLGDDLIEKKHLFLVGTKDAPICLDGPVVVHGSVIISGYVKGKGSIYSGGNIYIPGDLYYSDPPAMPRPAANDQPTVETWREAAMSKDALGLYAREHIVVGDYTNATWQKNVKSWINHPLNKSREDAGADGVQNTKAGRDGILGTADDDVLEDDGVWTVSTYTLEDALKGLIPPGKLVGDVIPGSGEDIDGDGKFDDTTAMTEFNIPESLSPDKWAGNINKTYAKYSQVATNYIKNIDAVLYTNHTLAALMINSGGDIKINGAIVSRNESIIYSAKRLLMNFDERLSGQGGETFGFYNPLAWKPVEVYQWEYDKQLPECTLNDPAAINSYFSGGS
jgi:hypothetical protein